jgi:D-glycero-D-manno-heptose 1,7-bisphosphate phosphatase
VTNQPDIARGTETIKGVQALNDAVAAEVPIDDFVICPHDDVDRCSCRKPLPGMLLDAAARLGLDVEHSFMVGDRWRDVEAGRRAGCTTVFVDRGYTEKKPEDPDIVVHELVEAVPHMLAAYITQQEGSRSNA